MNNPPLLVVTAHRMKAVIRDFLPRLEEAGWVVRVDVPEKQSFSAPDLVRVTAGATAIIVGDDEVSVRYLESAPKQLRLVVKWGVGTDSIDADAAHEMGILVKNTPGVFGGEVADLAMAYVLGLSRGVVAIHNGVLEKGWPHKEGISLEGKTLGIVGYGDAGQNLARRGFGFGMRTIFFDPHVAAGEDLVAQASNLEDLVSEADYLVLTCPSTRETQGMINRERLHKMKPSAYLINVARGDLVNESELVSALREGVIAGAGLDVYQVEPLPDSSPLRQLDNVILGAHNGSNTREGLLRASAKATEIVLQWQRENLL